MASDTTLLYAVGPAVRQLLVDVLGHEPPPDTPLRDCGLDSLAAARLRVEIEQRFGVLIPMAALSRCRGAAGLVSIMREQGAADSAVGRHAPEAGAAGTPFDLTTIQQAYLIGKDPDFSGDPIGCHLYREFELAAADPDRLAAAWRRVLAEQDMLRMVVTDDGRQRVLTEVPAWQLPVHQGGEPEVLAVRERLSYRCYDPQRWPLFDVEVTLRSDGPAIVHLSLDALVTDGAGLDYLLARWWRHYTEPDMPVARPELGARDCLRWLTGQAADGSVSQRRRRDMEYWGRRLSGMPDGPAITIPVPPRETCHRRVPLDDELDQAQWAALRRHAAALGVSDSALVLAVFAAAVRYQHRRAAPDEGAFSLVLTTSQRSQVPGGVPDVVAPFTSTAVVVVDADADDGVGHVAQALHDRLWEGLDHQSVSALDALRQVRGGDAAPLPVVFTSLLDSGRAIPRGSFGDAVTYMLSQTSDVVIDCQVTEAGGRLRVHWDVAPGLTAPGTCEVLFARFMNGLVACGQEADAVPGPPLNELQQAYHVARADGPVSWDGCQVYQAIEVDDLDPGRLAAAWAAMLADHAALRSYATADGEMRVLPGWPGPWRLPVITAEEADPGLESRLGADLVADSFPLGEWPQFDLRVTRRATGAAVIHLTLDLLLLDGRSTHLIARELLRRYAGQPSAPPPALPRTEPQAMQATDGDGAAEAEAAERYWARRIGALPPGPPLRLAPGQARTRLQDTVDGWPAIRQRLAARGISPDAALVAALNHAFAADFREPFATTLVRWTAQTESARPGEHTRLSWLASDSDSDYWATAHGIQQVIEQDSAADCASGLAQLRRAVLKRLTAAEVRYPVVHTGVLELADRPWPDGAQLRAWATCTPDVALDCIAMEEGDDTLRLFWDVAEGAFPPGRDSETFRRYVTTLRGLATPTAGVAVPAQAATREPGSGLIPAGLNAAEQDAVLRAWNDTVRPYSADGPVHALFERRAAAAPEAIAVRWRGGTMTYRELNRWANAIAARLAELVRRERREQLVVAVSTARGPEMVAAVYGVLKAGGAYLPVDPQLPAERARGMLADTGAAAVLVSCSPRSWTPGGGMPAVVVDADPVIAAARADESQADRDPHPGTGPDDLAYIIHTSGSTGRPRGVAVTHRPLHNLFQWAARLFRFTPADIGLCVTSLGFDLSAFDILGLLGYGASIYVADGEEQSDPGLLLDVLLDQQVTFWNSAPTTLNELAQLLPPAGGRTRALRLVFLSGDYTPLPLPALLRATFTRMLLVSLGGATEATIWSNYFPVLEVDPDWRSIPYGRPIDNSRYYILDENLKPCRPGQEGNLFIAGACLSQGYVGRPELTAERFVRDPFAAGQEELMYRTGDRAVYAGDGTIIFRGRLDGQVKIRGFRVELGEVEHRLRQHPDVGDVVALARDDPDGNKVLVAYVRPAGRRADPAELRCYAAEALPGYMVPSHVILVDSFPATANGKLDRGALPAPGAPHPPDAVPVREIPAVHAPAAEAPVALDQATPPAAPDPAPPVPAVVDHADLVAEIRALFEAHIGTDPLDPAGDLWDQGATSFTMVRVSAALRKKYRQRIPVAALVETPTIEGIARAIGAIVGAAPPAAQHPVPPPPLAATGPGPDAATHAAVPPEVDFLDDSGRVEFLRARWNRRAASPGDRCLALPRRGAADAGAALAAVRREFARRPVPLPGLAALLELLSPQPGDLERYRYPSAGHTYAVQAYVHVRDGGVDGIEVGVYYYQPDTHALKRLGPGSGLDRRLHFFYNRDVYDQCAFQLFLIGQVRGIEPLYGDDAQLFLAVEAGCMAQLLLEHQDETGIGLCPIGTVALGHLRPALGLDEGHRFLHAFLGGALAEQPATTPAPLAQGTAPTAPAAPAPTGRAAVPAARRPGEAVAVTGIAGRYASCADLDDFWELLSEGRAALREWPASRDSGSAPHAPVGGYLDAITPADPLRFGISPAEAAVTDPQLWLLLDAVRSCLDDAGVQPRGLAGAGLADTGRVGVFVATMWPDGQVSGADRWRAGEPALLSGIAADLPNRVSHLFGFHGPSVAVNTSCSSALTALHLARLSLLRDECDTAIVAAVNVIAHPYHPALLRGLDLVASRPGGAFAADAAGWTPGEGAGAVLLRLEEAALVGGDPVHGVIEGSWIGHAGHTRRFGAPSAAALAGSLRDGLAASGLGPGDIGYLECAAAGAMIADAAEIEAMQSAFAGVPQPVLFGTVKPNIGHLESASGLSQLAKVILQMRAGRIAPTLAAAELSPLVSWDPGVLRLATRSTSWMPDPGRPPRRALVNAVGATGSYAHVIVRAAGEGGAAA